jgi:hypothetical protein
MSREIEEKIRRLEEIRKDNRAGSYLNPFKAKEHIDFLLSLLEELTDALFQIHQAVREVRLNDTNLDSQDPKTPDPLPS